MLVADRDAMLASESTVRRPTESDRLVQHNPVQIGTLVVHT
jgi:hypothetical protein